MKIYNATNSKLDLPYGMQRLRINPQSFSVDFMGTIEFIKTLVTSYSTDQVAILVGGPYELSMCANVPVAVSYVAQTTDEIIQRFGLESKKKEEPKEKEVLMGEFSEEPKEEVEETPAPKPKKKRTTKKTSE